MKKIAKNTVLFLFSLLGVLHLSSLPVYRLDDRFYENLVPDYKQFNETNRAFFRLKTPDNLTRQYSKIERIAQNLIRHIDAKLNDPAHPESEKKLLRHLRKRVTVRLNTAKERMTRTRMSAQK